jgi:hypothetical protein
MWCGDGHVYMNKKFWEELIAYFSLIRNGQHRKRRLQKIFRCSGNVFTEPLPSNDRGIHIQTQRLMGGVYEARRSDGLRCYDIRTKFHKDW